MPTTAFISTDLTSLRLLSDASDVRWTAEPAGADANGAAPMAQSIRQRAMEAANWLASRPEVARKLDLVCLDVDEALCLWLKSPSREEPAIIAAATAAAQDWGQSLPLGTVQGLWEPTPAQADGPPTSALARWRQKLNQRARAPVIGAHGVAISTPDSLVRLWLDDLDERGIRADRVASLWHVMAQAWGESSPSENSNSPDDAELCAVLLIERDRRAVWAWARGQELIVGGQSALPRAPAPREEEEAPDPAAACAAAAARMSMDWLSWGAQLGTAPTRFVIIGDDTEGWSRALSDRWPGASKASCIPSADPLGQTVLRAAQSDSDPSLADDPRRAMVRLTRRPTRALRARYRWGAVALVLLSMGLAGLAWRVQQAAADLRAAAASTREQIQVRIQSLNDPTLAAARSPLRTLESELMRLRTRDPIKLPESPKPIYGEVVRAVNTLTQFEEARLTQLMIDSVQSATLQFTLPDRRAEEELTAKLEQPGGKINWTKRAIGNSRDPLVHFNGEWLRGE